MFDIGLGELAICFLVALLVLGPEKLPKLARTLGTWTGRARGYLRHITSEIEHEVHAAEIRKQVMALDAGAQQGQQQIQQNITQLVDDVKTTQSPPTPQPAAPLTQ